MKTTEAKLKQIIKEELTDHWDNRDKIAMSGMAEDNRVAAILSEFTPEEIDLLRKDLESRTQTRSLEEVVEMYLDHPEMGEDKLIKIMRSIIAHGSSDAMFAAEK